MATSKRALKRPETTAPFAVATMAVSSAPLSSGRPKAMPVVLSPRDAHAWLTAPPADALKLQRSVPDGVLQLLPRDAI